MAVKQNVIAALSDLPHAQEVQEYLIDMAVAATGRKKPSSDYVHDLNRKSGVFVNSADLENILDQIQAIYLEQGYRKPWELENDLIRLYQPDMPEEAIAIADFYAAEELAPDHLTGYHHKTQVPLVMGLAAFYTKVTGRPVSVLEVDYSNMRGTNDHFAKLIGAAENMPPDSVMRDAMMMTDYMSFVIAQSITKTLEENLPAEEATLIPLRTGGDEVRVVIPDLLPGDGEGLLHEIHARIEEATAMAGLHDHIHSKRPLDEWSNGFGACGTVFALTAEGHDHYSDAIRDADHAIQATKTSLGRQRLDNPYFESLKPPGSKDKAIYTDQALAATHYTAVMDAIAGLHQKLVNLDMEPAQAPTLESLADALQPDHFLTLPEIRAQFHVHLKEELKAKGITLTPAQENILQIKVTRFPAQDFASGTLMARDLPAMAGAALRVHEQIGRKTGNDAPLWTLGISFHNLAGLNETLGHDASNVVLHHQARHIVEESFFKAGIARENFVLGHMGGGEFRAIIQPVIPQSDGTLHLVSQEAMDQICRDIERRTRQLNATTLKHFATVNNLRLDTDRMPEYFADIQNPRMELRPSEDGITATLSARPYYADARMNTHESRRGGALAAFIGEGLEEAVRERREEQKAVFPTGHIPPAGQKEKLGF